MHYMLLVLEPVGQRAARDEPAGRDAYARMSAYAARLKERGVLVRADALTSAAQRLRGAGERAQLFDGPFTESKELIGGYFLLECATRAQALALARECPALEWATIEVREIGTCYQ